MVDSLVHPRRVKSGIVNTCGLVLRLFACNKRRSAGNANGLKGLTKPLYDRFASGDVGVLPLTVFLPAWERSPPDWRVGGAFSASSSLASSVFFPGSIVACASASGLPPRSQAPLPSPARRHRISTSTAAKRVRCSVSRRQ